MDYDLQRPDYVDDHSWLAIERSHGRLLRAVEIEDRPQAIGSMKDLIETIAKVILTLRGDVIERADFHVIVGRAHGAIERQPGKGLAQTEPLRSIANGALTIAKRLGEVRNELGTGHGRAIEPSVENEIYAISMEAGMLWCRWSLARLSAMAFGLPNPLIEDLSHGWFYSGDLTARLEAARINELDPAQQRRLGVAVGRRAMRETFLVKREGVQACADSPDLESWPTGYRTGVLNGLFFNQNERLTVDEWMASMAPRLVAPVPDLVTHLEELREKIANTEYVFSYDDYAQDRGIYRALRSEVTVLPDEAQTTWLDIAEHFRPEPPF